MSQIKQKLAAKLTDLLGCSINPNEILFCKGGNRTDVVRWCTTSGYECFAAAGFSSRADVKLTLAEQPRPYGALEIYATQIQTVKHGAPAAKASPFDTSSRRQ